MSQMRVRSSFQVIHLNLALSARTKGVSVLVQALLTDGKSQLLRSMIGYC